MLQTHRDRTSGSDTLTLTCDRQFGVGDVRTAHHAVVALIFDLAILDFQIMAVPHAADVVLFAVVQFLGAFVPGERDLWVVDLNLALKSGALVLRDGLVSDVLHHRDRLSKKNPFHQRLKLCIVKSLLIRNHIKFFSIIY